MRLALVDNWRKGWKWASVQLSAVSGGTHAVLASIAGGMKMVLPLVGVVPLRWIFVAGAVVSIGTLVGRMVKREARPNG